MGDNSTNWKRNKPPSRGLSVAWKNIKVSATETESHVFKKCHYKHKEILHGVSGAVQAGTLTAILGASGGGKSTLLSVLANRNSTDLQIEGRITIGGKPKGEFIRYVSGFVYQDDLFITTLTVTEHLNFTIKLRLGKHINEKARSLLIEDTLNSLGLTHVAHRRIGDSSLGKEKISLSGGEKKRLSIATELITHPGLLFCDEPTTGLDSFTAFNVMTYLKSLTVLQQKTVLCSIHQPNAQILELFHQIILLSEGKIVFSGTSEEAVEFFQERGYKYNEDENAAEYLIKSIAATKSSSTTGINELCSSYQNSKFYKRTTEFIEGEFNTEIYNDSVVNYKSLDEVSWINKLLYLTQRNLLCVTRDLSVQGVRFMQKMAVALLIGFTFRGSISWTQTGVTALVGAVYLILQQNLFLAVRVTMMHFPQRLSIFHREYANNITTPLIFYLSSVLSLLPGSILDPVLYTLLVCTLIGLTPSVSVVASACFVTTMVLNTSGAFGMMLSLMFEFDVAASIVDTTFTIFNIFSGIFIKISTIPWVLRWVPYISWFTCACEALFVIVTRDVTDIACDYPPDVPCISTGDELLAVYDFAAANLWLDIIKICSMYFILNIIAYVSLLMKVKGRKA